MARLAAVAKMPLPPNTRLGRYEIRKQLGAGGMGEVYLADDTKLDRRVALKILPPEFAADKDRMNRFVREAKSASALNHPNIITIHEIGEFDGTHFIATEFIDGKTLNEYVKGNSLNLKSFLEIAIQIASALDEAHSAGIVHRDIKPDNVMIRANGLAKILDFGIAKLAAPSETGEEAATAIQGATTPGMIIGTPNYMSPEQARGQRVDQQTDIFSFGVVLYEILSGASPFAGETVSDVIAAVLTKEPPSLTNVPPELAEIIQKTLQKDKRNRYQTAKHLLDALKEVKEELAIQSRLKSISQSNIEEPQTQILRAKAAAEKSPTSTTGSEEGFWVAILPFKYRGANADLEDLAEGLSEEIITGLSRFPYLQVIARSSTEHFSTAEFADVRSIGMQLGVRYLLDGRLRQSGTTVRIAVQLVDATTGAHLWAETYDRALHSDEIFAIQDELVPRIVSTIADQHGVLVHTMMDALRKKDKNQITPSEAVMSVFSFHERVTAENHTVVRDLLEHTVRKFPNEGNCWAMLETLYCDEYMFGFNPEPDSLGRALAAAQRAVELAPTSNLACQALAQAHFFRREFEAFRPLAERTIVLNPMDGATVALMGVLIACSGEWERGCKVTHQAMRLNPHFPGWYRLAVLFDAYRRSDYRAALGEAEKINLPNYFWTLVLRAASLGQLGELEKAREALRELLAARPDFTKAAPEEFGRWFDAELVEHLMDGLRKAGLKTVSAPNAGEQKTQILNAQTTAEEKPTEVGTQNSIAVLPFTNMSSDEENEYFCDGLAEELLNALAKIEDLKVAARTSAFSFKGKNANVSEIGEKLSVRNVLEGSVRQSGNKLRISVQLVNAADGYQFWSERYDREMQDIFDVQDEIALAVVDALKLKLFGDEKAAVLKRYTNNAEAYQLYLNGRYHYSKRGKIDLQRGIEYFQEAIKLDPNFALAYVGIADSYNAMPGFAYLSPHEATSHARAAAQKAIEIDPLLAEAHAALADCFATYDFNWSGAEHEYLRAIELNPNSAISHFHFATYYLTPMGRMNEATAEMSRALELEPFNLIINANLVGTYLFARQNEKALEQAKKLFDLEPDFVAGQFWLGMAYSVNGKRDEAIAHTEKFLQTNPQNQLLLMLAGVVYAESGRQDKAEQIIERFRELAKTQYVVSYYLATIYSALGKKDEAIGELEKSLEQRDFYFSSLNNNFVMVSLRDDMRFQDLIQRAGLPINKNNQTDESLEAKTVMLSSSDAGNDLAMQKADFRSDSEQTTDTKSEIRNPKSKWWLFGLLGLLILVGGFFGYKYFAPTNKQIESIAVMPSENKSGNPDSEYLSDGLAESLIYRL